MRAYQSDFRDFAAFCIKNGLSSIPTQPKILAIYITHLSKTSKFSTLKRRIASISVIHKLKGHYLDTKHPIIMENLHGIKRTLGSRQKAKKPILINDLKLIIKAIDKKKIRDKALILIGFAGGFRRSELVNIDYHDIEFVPEGVKILLKDLKQINQEKEILRLSPTLIIKNFCPVIALKNFINVKFENLKDGKIFNLSDKSVALIIKKYAEKAGLDSTKYAGHSLRSGFATTAAEFGAEERNIMAMTGHKTTQMVRRYIHEANLFKNNALNKIKI